MKTETGKVGYMAMKVDLETIYDRLNWHFIKDILQDIGLPGELIEVIWWCINSADMKLLWNGEATNSLSF